MLRRTLPIAVAVTALTAGTAVACARGVHSTSPRAAAPSGLRFQTWLYPGGPGEPACTAAAE
ncbi:MAG: hypothetical protein JWO67_6803, partial [Streptosporangiaceae bacterium]|nr:hypothetical protein [Streptosporangiaceae bacterium]